MSTSLDKDMAHNQFVEGDGPKARIEIRAPKGTHAGYMNAASDDQEFAHERELLLPRGTQYRIVSNEKAPNGDVHVVMEVAHGG